MIVGRLLHQIGQFHSCHFPVGDMYYLMDYIAIF